MKKNAETQRFVEALLSKEIWHDIGDEAVRSKSDWQFYGRYVLTKSIDSFEDEYREMTTPVEELWLQDRRAYSIPLPIYEGAPGSDMFKLFNGFTQLYSNFPSIKAVSLVGYLGIQS